VDVIGARENGIRWDGRGRGLGGVRSQWGGDMGGERRRVDTREKAPASCAKSYSVLCARIGVRVKLDSHANAFKTLID
jgi:hypothetical protein